MKGLRKRLFSLVAVAAMMTTIVPSSIASAAQSNSSEETTNAVAVSTDSNVQERKIITYFSEWAYKNDVVDNYTADRLPWDKLTHINYAFAHVGEDNKIAIGDVAAATEMDFPGVTDDFPYKGHFNVINSYKKKYPNVKSLISIGGWAESSGFYTMAHTAEGRETFANSVVDFIRTYGFDGADIDYEYPTNLEDAGNPNDFELAKPLRQYLYDDYCQLMKLLREKIDAASKEDGKKYLLTAAVTASGWVVGGMGDDNYTEYLDYVNLMTYDFHGSWNGYVSHNSALYSNPNDPETKQIGYNYLSTDWAVKYYSATCEPSKIVIGVPFYTRGWEKVTPSTYPGGLFGSSWQGKVDETEGWGATGEANIWHDDLPDGSEEPGGCNPLWHVKNLLNDKTKDYVRYWDDVAKVPYVWNETEKIWLSFEDEESMTAKMNYIVDNNLGGMMSWEMVGDFDYDETTGQYVVGDTLTSIAKDIFDKADPLVVEEKVNTLPVANYDIKMVNNFDHPYNDYEIQFVNNTGATIAKPWTIEFDLPNSIYFKTEPWASGATVTKTEDGMNIHFKITSGDWASDLATGTTTLIIGTSVLKPFGGPKNLVCNGKASEAEWGKQPELKAATVSLSTNNTTVGNYTVSVDVPENSNGTTMELYEGNTKIKTETLTSAAKTYKYNITGKADGTYSYKAVIKNGGTIINSNIASVYVGPKVDLKSAVINTSTSNSTDGTYTLKVYVPENSNGTTMELYEGENVIKTETITNEAKVFTYEMSGKADGTYSYKALIKKGTPWAESNTVNVKVEIKTGGAEEFVSGKAYGLGDRVIYNGIIYESLASWTGGIVPGTHPGIWKEIGPAEAEKNLIDLSTIASKYRTKAGTIGYEDDCDINKDGIIDIVDIVLVAKEM